MAAAQVAVSTANFAFVTASLHQIVYFLVPLVLGSILLVGAELFRWRAG